MAVEPSLHAEPGSAVTNALTFDVEDYYMVSAFSDQVPFEQWPAFESRVERNTGRILELLGERKVTATFFVLGWIAERFPGLVKRIHAAGHEVASHGYNHRLVYGMTPEQFRQDVKRSKQALEDLSGCAVLGYRAPSYSIVAASLWALDVLIEEGFRYDSSIFPIHHDRYGIPGAGRFPHVLERPSGRIVEFPPSTVRLFGQNLPVAGGGYLRLYPLAVTRAAMYSINKREGKPVILYVHPWEIDPDQPRMQGPLGARVRHYINIGSTLPKLTAFLSEFAFDRLSRFLHDFWSEPIPRGLPRG
jgi:polysaccharide deacetylase family protein (PEP-CTERM system associated)